jgi:hypothetical protein
MSVQKTKTQRRRERKMQQEAEDDKRIKQELAEVGNTERETELQHLQQILLQHGLQLFEIPVRGCQLRVCHSSLAQKPSANPLRTDMQAVHNVLDHDFDDPHVTCL